MGSSSPKFGVKISPKCLSCHHLVLWRSWQNPETPGVFLKLLWSTLSTLPVRCVFPPNSGIFVLCKASVVNLGRTHPTSNSRDKDGCTPNVRVPMVFSWCSTLGFLGIVTHKYPLYRAYIGISHRGTLVGVHPTIPWQIHSLKLTFMAIQPPPRATYPPPRNSRPYDQGLLRIGFP